MPARWTAACLTAIIACAACAIGGPPLPVIRIGVDLPLKGAEARAAKPALNGIQFYVQQHPSLNGFSIQLTIKDDTAGGVPDPVKGSDNMTAFVQDSGVLAVIGPFDSSVARTEIPVANQAQLAMVSPVTSSPCLTKDVYLPAALSLSHSPVTCKDAGLPAASGLRPTGVNNYFRLAPTDELQGPAAADYLFNTLQVLRAAVVSDHEAYGQALADSFSTRFARLGGSVVGRLELDPSADATSFLQRMKADGAQAVYYGGVTANRGCVVRSQMAGVFGSGSSAPFAGGDGIAEDPACLRDAGAAFGGIYATVPAIDPVAVASANGVVRDFKSAYPSPSDFGPYTVVAYDATAVVYNALDHAIKAAGGHAPKRRNVVLQLATTTSFAGATGTIGFDPAGDATHRVLAVYRSPASTATGVWTLAGSVDYTTALPY